jgi:hypothetical protein
MQRHAAFAVPLRTGDFRAVEAATTLTLMPSAPRRIALPTARFIARRNMMRRSSCCAIDSATSCASSSGLRTSVTLMCAGTPIIVGHFLAQLLDVLARLPITTPGRAVWMVTRAVLAGRSIRILLIPAAASFLRSISRTLRSAAR